METVWSKRIDQIQIWMGKTCSYGTGRIQCEVLTTLPFCFSWIKKFLGQQWKIWDDSLVRNYSGNLQKIFNIVGPTT